MARTDTGTLADGDDTWARDELSRARSVLKPSELKPKKRRKGRNQGGLAMSEEEYFKAFGGVEACAPQLRSMGGESSGIAARTARREEPETEDAASSSAAADAPQGSKKQRRGEARTGVVLVGGEGPDGHEEEREFNDAAEPQPLWATNDRPADVSAAAELDRQVGRGAEPAPRDQAAAAARAAYAALKRSRKGGAIL